MATLAICFASTLRGLAAHERQERAVAVGRVAVGHAIALEPVLVLVDDGLTQFGRAGPPDASARRRRACGRSPGRSAGCPSGVEVDALDRERRLVVGVELGARREEIDEGDVAGARRPRPSPWCRAPDARCSPCRRAGRDCRGPRARSARTARPAGPTCRCTSARACARSRRSRSFLNASRPASPANDSL